MTTVEQACNALENAVRKLLQCGPPYFEPNHPDDERAWHEAQSVAFRALALKKEVLCK